VANFHTPLLGLVKQVTGENPDGLWGDALNDGFMTLVEAAISGRTDVSVTAGNVTLSADIGIANQARAMFLIATGTPGVPRDVTVPNTQKLYLVANESDDAVTVKTAVGSGVSVAVGDMVVVYVDQLLDDVIQVSSGGTFVVPDAAYGTPIPGTMDNESGGPTAVSMNIHQQGAIATVAIPMPSLVIINSTAQVWTPDSPPYAPAPAVDTEFLVHLQQTVTVVAAFVRFLADGSAVEFIKADGTAWGFATSRSWPNGWDRAPYMKYSTV